MADQNSSVEPIDPYKFLNIIYNPSDDTLTRNNHFPSTPITPDVKNAKDISLNTTKKTWVRLFRPNEPSLNRKLPIIVYSHGGGFILQSASDTVFHNFCASMANILPALVVSIEYRLAPESRLPGAYEDTIEAINWVKNQALDMNGEQWLKDFADFSNCYLMGSSAGGNIVYHAGLRALSLDLDPLIIKGFILNSPFFGGSKRTESELRLINDTLLPLAVNDLMWELSLPKGCDRGHEYCNPMVDSSYKQNIGLIEKCFVSVGGEDPLMDREMEFVKMLKEKGVKVVVWFDKEGLHGMEITVPGKDQALFVLLKSFVY